MIFRKIALFVFLSITTNFVLAQSITGFGDYKIGMSIAEFMELDEIKNLALKDKTRAMHVPEGGDIWRTTSLSDLESYNKIYSEDIVKYEFNIATGVQSIGRDSYWTTVRFFKGKLAQVYIYSPPVEFLEILTAKYGKPKNIDKTKAVTCQNGFGARTQHRDGSNSYLWTQKGSIRAEYRYSWWDCGKISNSYTVEDKNSADIMEKLQDAGQEAAKTNETKLKATSSKL